MVPFRTTAFCVSMASSYQAIPMTAMILSSPPTLRPHFGSRSKSSRYQPDSMRPVPSPTHSPNRYQGMSSATSAYSVLRLARKRAEDLLAAAESGRGRRGDLSPLARCANCDKVSGPLMLCGRCKAVAYCTRTCQVAHYKEHKVVCRALSAASKSGPKMV